MDKEVNWLFCKRFSAKKRNKIFGNGKLVSFSLILTWSERSNVRAGHGLNLGVIGCKIGKYHAVHEDVLAYCESNYLFIFLRL